MEKEGEKVGDLLYTRGELLIKLWGNSLRVWQGIGEELTEQIRNGSPSERGRG